MYSLNPKGSEGTQQVPHGLVFSSLSLSVCLEAGFSFARA